jgi:hypothetical protein
MTEVAKSKCPICGAPHAPETKPFCSRRCRDVDLGRWLTGQYAIPSAEPVEEADLATATQRGKEGEDSDAEDR